MRLIALVMVVTISQVSAEDGLPPNSIECSQFKKVGADVWTEIGTASFGLGGIVSMTLANTPVTPRSHVFEGVDLYRMLERKCSFI